MMEHTDPAPMPKNMRERRMNDPISVRYSLGILVASCYCCYCEDCCCVVVLVSCSRNRIEMVIVS